MSPVQRAMLGVSLVLLALLLASLFQRRLYRLCYGFAAWLLAVFAGDGLMFCCPDRFYNWGFWVVKETAYAVLKLAMAAEITALSFEAFPSARATARRVIMAMLAGLLAFVVIGVDYRAGLDQLARDLHRRTANGVALVYCATWAVILWYRLPLHWLHRAILRGLVPYLLVFAAANTLTLELGWQVRDEVNLADGAAWCLVVAYWCREVWRGRPGGDTPFMRQIQPWRDRM
jgi:hypothetical protein